MSLNVVSRLAAPASQFLSQYPGEAEVLFGPLTGLEAINDGFIDGTIRHITIRPTVNQRAVRSYRVCCCACLQMCEKAVYGKGQSSVCLVKITCSSNTSTVSNCSDNNKPSQVRIEILVEQRKELHKQTLASMRQELVGKIAHEKLMSRFDEHVRFVSKIQGMHFNADQFNRCDTMSRQLRELCS